MAVAPSQASRVERLENERQMYEHHKWRGYPPKEIDFEAVTALTIEYFMNASDEAIREVMMALDRIGYTRKRFMASSK